MGKAHRPEGLEIVVAAGLALERAAVLSLAGLAAQTLRIRAPQTACVATNGRDQNTHVHVLAVDARPRRVSHLRHVLQWVLAAPVIGEGRLHPRMMR